MKTKFLPTMIGAILAGGMAVAQADVQVFGHIDLSLDSTDVEKEFSGSSEDADDFNMNSNTSSVGFKGSEDLGNGLKAIFKIDFQYDVDAVGSITDRDQWVGLKGNFGQVRLGTISTGYKSHGAMIDPLYRTSLQGRSRGLQSPFHGGAGEGLEGRAEETIRYDSPSFNGLKVVAHYTLDNDEDHRDVFRENDLDEEEDEDPYGIGASYSNGGILVFADYLDNAQDSDHELSAWKVGGKYSLNNFAVMGQYEDADSGDDEFSLWHVGGSYTMGNNMIYVAYGQGEEDNKFSSDTDTEAWTIAGTHSLSKRTKLYAGYNTQNKDVEGSTDGDRDQFSVGVKHKF